MDLQAQYDPQEDRIRLTLYPADAVPRAFWVSRRQWLDLLHMLLALPQAEGGKTPAPPRAKGAPALADVPLPKAVAVQAIRLRRLARGMKLVFVAGAEAVALTLQDEGLRRLRQMLQQQAERAGWDTGAALVRLNAQDMARAAVSKARQRG